MRDLLIGFLVSAALAGAVEAAPAPFRPAAEPACSTQTFETSTFTVCAYRPARDRLSLAWAGPKGPLGDFEALKRSLGSRAAQVRFAMNAGMYDSRQAPVGLLVLRRRTEHKADTASGAGNFYLKPNGVFWVGKDGAPHVVETGRFLAEASAAQWATQSGPLLVEAGKLHPAILPDGASVYVRNGVGVAGRDLAYFVISDAPVSFGRFARFFRDALHCPDALYFDGHISSLWAPSLGRQDPRTGLGPFVLVMDRAKKNGERKAPR